MQKLPHLTSFVSGLVDVIPLLDNFDYGHEFSEQDTLGRIYEYFSSKFAQLNNVW